MGTNNHTKGVIFAKWEVSIDLYTDYLPSSFGPTTATGLSRLVNGDISHNGICRFLSNNDFASKELWQDDVKPFVREHEKEEACLLFDDVIIEKPHTDDGA